MIANGSDDRRSTSEWIMPKGTYRGDDNETISTYATIKVRGSSGNVALIDRLERRFLF